MSRRFAVALASIVLMGPTARADPGDHALFIGDEAVCATNAATCRDAREAIAAGRLEGIGVSRGTLTRCEPHPDCFPARARCIVGYTGRRAGVRCPTR